MFISGGHAAAVMRAGAHCSAESSCKEAFSGYDAAEYIMCAASTYEDCAEEILYNCDMYVKHLFVSSRLTMSLSGEAHLPAAKKLIRALPYRDAYRSVVHYPLLSEKKEGIQVPSQVSYAVLGNNLQNYDTEYGGALRVIAQILTYGFLWNEIRVKGGAYGTGFAVSPSGNVAAWSYRDPTPEASVEIYRKIADYIETFAEENPDLTSYIIGTIAASEPLDSPARKIRNADARWFSHITYETRKKIRTEILSATPEDLLRFSAAIRRAMEEGNMCVVGSAEKLKACGAESVYTLT
jgi:Zn-dependent M16 (insulinase) family peptidase